MSFHANGAPPSAGAMGRRFNVALAIQKADIASLAKMKDAGVDFDAWRDARGANAAIKACELTNEKATKLVLQFARSMGASDGEPKYVSR